MEVLQLACLEPELAILDEVDSGAVGKNTLCSLMLGSGSWARPRPPSITVPLAPGFAASPPAADRPSPARAAATR